MKAIYPNINKNGYTWNWHRTQKKRNSPVSVSSANISYNKQIFFSGIPLNSTKHIDVFQEKRSEQSYVKEEIKCTTLMKLP